MMKNIINSILSKNLTAKDLKYIELIIKADILNTINKKHKKNDIRIITHLNTSGNFGCAIMDFNGEKQLFIAHSKVQKEKDWELVNAMFSEPYLKGAIRCYRAEELNQRYTTEWLDDNLDKDTLTAYDRNRDTESKILEEVASYLDNQGYNESKDEISLYLYTVKEPCPSCSKVINTFKSDFREINLEVYYQNNLIKK
ncbi:deaminase domain-containing protein [Bacillus suaedaesalsae]|uniref:CMP/dCMP-type deaminase domain-containing protein n=1 Tax=Bacillus suaedaesalsae TaxID=2810349 RepID=A0ABS2DFP8_9BACI|nr:deaminase domain-containing protein [Bacillus suaedaesalsae]MBM6617275.1 hypothetical protein [Bacillus suaedaesalsae]